MEYQIQNNGLTNIVIPSGLVPKGEYSALTDYSVGDMVSYNGSSYVMYVDAPSGTIPTNTEYWAPEGQMGPSGQGVPTGGTTGQVLKKTSGSDYDTDWADEGSVGGGISEELAIAYSLSL